VNELRSRAKDALLSQEIAREENVSKASEDLVSLDGMTAELLDKLAQADVHTRDDLADLASTS
jgi:N utilization substance protein A